MKWIIFRSKLEGKKASAVRLAGCSAGQHSCFLPRKAAIPCDLLLALRDVQMGTINKGTLPFLSPSESALLLVTAFSPWPGIGERVGGRRSDNMFADGASWNS